METEKQELMLGSGSQLQVAPPSSNTTTITCPDKSDPADKRPKSIVVLLGMTPEGKDLFSRHSLKSGHTVKLVSPQTLTKILIWLS